MDMKVTDMRYENRYGLGTDPLSTEDCVSPAYFAEEKERLLKRAWLCVGREDVSCAFGVALAPWSHCT